MGRLSNIIPVSDLRQDAAGVLKRLRNSHELVVITQRGRAAAVLVSVEAFERSEHDLQVLRLLAKGEREIEAGEGHDLDAVLRDLDNLMDADLP
jgi:prevent-host-death family protein